MEIILKAISGGSRFEFPSNPSEISIKNGPNYQSYKIIGLGAVKIPKGTNCEEISWDGYFFGSSKRNEPMMQSYMEPNRCVDILETFRDKGTPLAVMCTGVGINRDMTISDFKWTPYGGHGNVKYSITFTQWKDLQVKILSSAETNEESASEEEEEPASREEDTPEERPEPPPAENYTIAYGDTLWGIAQRTFGDGSRWPEIYAANSEVLESSAKEHGYGSSNNGNWIFPGATITIPS